MEIYNKKLFPTLLNPCRIIFCWSGQVYHLWVWKIFLNKINPFNFLSCPVKKNLQVGSKNTRFKTRLAPFLLRVKNMIRSGWIKAIRWFFFIKAFKIKFLYSQLKMRSKIFIETIQLPINITQKSITLFSQLLYTYNINAKRWRKLLFFISPIGNEIGIKKKSF